MNQLKNQKVWITGGLVVLNVLYFLYLDLTGSSTSWEYLRQKGAMYTPDIIQNKEYYRLITAMFMHSGIEHLVNNMLVLCVMGEYMERALGRITYLVFYLACGIGVNLVTLWMNLHGRIPAVGVGASGAIFGLTGGLLGMVIAHRGKLYGLSTRQLLVMIVVSLYLGFTQQNVDNTAHISGLIIGFLGSILIVIKMKRGQGYGNE